MDFSHLWHQMSQISQAMDLCPLQDSFLFRARFLGWQIADWILDEMGEIDFAKVLQLQQKLIKTPFPLGSQMEGDQAIYAHLLSCCTALLEKKEMTVTFKKFSLPICHKKAEEILRDSLWPEEVVKLQTLHVRKAVLAALFTLLRQATGSCFATAPAILIQRHLPELFLKDLYDLLSTGQLKRVVRGRSYAVPLAPNAGVGDLRRGLPRSLSHTSLAMAPGLRIALEAGGFFQGISSPREKLESLHRALELLAPEMDTPEKLIRALLMGVVGLSEDQILEEEKSSDIQMSLLASREGMFYQKPTEKGEKVASFKKNIAKAYAAFRSFTESPLLRAWEYTIASFCDVKLEFARWNLYVGIGFHPDQKGGVADFLYKTFDEQLRSCNTEITSLQKVYEEAFHQARSLESVLQRTTSETRHHQLKAELMGAMHQADTALALRDKAAQKGAALSQAFSSLLEQYNGKLQDHFQEIFDPSVLGEKASQYEDSPAGFRLIYKHGRSDASAWTSIHTPKEYSASLREFFSSIEADLTVPPPLDRQFIQEITTALLGYLQQDVFLDSAMQRAVSQGRLSPWEYVSGGTMQSLLQTYFSRESDISAIAYTPHSAHEVIQFLLQAGSSQKGPLLMQSPTHAFIFHPSWIAPEDIEALKTCVQRASEWKLDVQEQEYLAHKLSEKIPSSDRALFLHLYRQQTETHTPKEFRKRLNEALQAVRSLQSEELIDSVLYSNFPLFSREKGHQAIEELLQIKWAEFTCDDFIGASELFDRAKASLFASQAELFSSTDLELALAERARHLGLLYPHPLLFADTNWSKWVFGWIVNPATAELELWRLNRTATQGAPMSEWKTFFSSENHSPWIIFPKNNEYI